MGPVLNAAASVLVQRVRSYWRSRRPPRHAFLAVDYMCALLVILATAAHSATASRDPSHVIRRAMYALYQRRRRLRRAAQQILKTFTRASRQIPRPSNPC